MHYAQLRALLHGRRDICPELRATSVEEQHTVAGLEVHARDTVHLACLPGDAGAVLPLGDARSLLPRAHVPSAVRLPSHHLAYVMFTSGSTGRPKGSLLEHRGLVNQTVALNASVGLSTEDVVFQFASLSFDMSVIDYFMALCHGAVLQLWRQGYWLDALLARQLLQECQVNPIFLPRDYVMPLFGGFTVNLLPIQLHGLAYGIFASVIAPFGGFFASAIKRAYDLKDFDNFFPGHGGMMDRMDCQMLTSLFVAVYMQTFVRDL